MNRRLCTWQSHLIIALLSLLSLASLAQQSSPAPVRMIFAASLPLVHQPKQGDYANLASAVNQMRNDSQVANFFIFGGGSLGPSPMSAFDRGSHIIDVLNSLEPDAMGISKREFSYFEEELSLRAYEAAFPLVASNIIDNATGDSLAGLNPVVVITKQDVTIGVLSVIDPNVKEEYLLSRVDVLPPEQQITHLAKQLRDKVDILVLLYTDYYAFVPSLIEQGLVDLALLIDSDFDFETQAEEVFHPNVVYFDQPAQLADITVHLDSEKRRPPNVNWRTFPLSDFTPAPDVEEQTLAYAHRIDRLLNQAIGVLMSDMDTQRDHVRSTENGFANYITDTMRDYSNADIALINGGVIRSDNVLPAGHTLVRRDILNALPFRSRLRTLQVSGQQLLQALESGLSEVEDLKGRFPHTSGLTIRYDSQRAPFERLVSVTHQGQPIVADRQYKLVTTDYIANGGDGFDMLQTASSLDNPTRLSPLLSQLIINAIRSQKSVRFNKQQRVLDLHGVADE
ncbi:bifunctional metallophosphatase/5'-nucleotidase [Aestuariibacter halophilus]|uniref:Bifunctional metallophosphatase/5'-nucleotidase n=1 Tax=Fluctibacter halophilus TaxID=226011 RepID=A0ABS8G9R8_9ALTE|nr:5'-nucleotidase C-terminal domain-containing protein [Aestuariibacter halophilus]MCC2617320.1 bifunctional metallophosphatase/5'-nucleotidase [Aestuariibacter halophilus]